jgi:hypothetical protein
MRRASDEEGVLGDDRLTSLDRLVEIALRFGDSRSEMTRRRMCTRRGPSPDDGCRPPRFAYQERC